MKKIALILAAVMLFACCSAFADETLEIKPEDFTLELSAASERPETAIGAAAVLAISQTDTVTKENNVTRVVSGSVTMTLDLEKHPTVLCFTQDMYASFDAYLQCGDPQGLSQWMIENQINFFLYDLETELQDYVYCKGSDSMSKMVGTLSRLSDGNKQSVVSCVGADSYVEAGGQTWMVMANNGMLVTIFKDQYYIVEYGGTDDAAADLEDTLSLLESLSFE